MSKQILDQMLDTKHLGQIAESMYEWEGLVADQLGLSLADVNNIKTKYRAELTLQVWVVIHLYHTNYYADFVLVPQASCTGEMETV